MELPAGRISIVEVAKVVVHDGSQMLMLERSLGVTPSVLDIPGGRGLPDIRPVVTARDKLREETGIRTPVCSLENFCIRTREQRTRGQHVAEQTFYFQLRLPRIPPPQLSAKHSGWMLWDPTDANVAALRRQSAQLADVIIFLTGFGGKR